LGVGQLKQRIGRLPIVCDVVMLHVLSVELVESVDSTETPGTSTSKTSRKGEEVKREYIEQPKQSFQCLFRQVVPEDLG
jgi:hypothetical protein